MYKQSITMPCSNQKCNGNTKSDGATNDFFSENKNFKGVMSCDSCPFLPSIVWRMMVNNMMVEGHNSHSDAHPQWAKNG